MCEASSGKQCSFNSKAYFVNDNGANMCVIIEAYGQFITVIEVKTCHFHFKNDARAKVSKDGDAYREEFPEIYKALHRVNNHAIVQVKIRGHSLYFFQHYIGGYSGGIPESIMCFLH